MILDNFVILSGGFSAAGVVTGQAVNGAGTFVSTNSVDNGPLPLNQLGDQGAGESMDITFCILTAPTVGTTCKYQIIEADDAALTVNVTIINSSADIPIASLPIGTQVPVHYDRAVPFAPRRFWGLQYVNVGAIATHSVFAGLLKDAQFLKSMIYKSGYGVA